MKVRLGFINTAGQQKGVDSLIVTDLIELARQKAICDALLLSGDEDVRIGVQLAQNHGVRVHLLGIHPSRGSQSLQLIHEADTSTEWDRTEMAEFLSIRRNPRTSAAQVDENSSTSALNEQAKALAESLLAQDLAALTEHFGGTRGVPAEFDSQLLAAGRMLLGRDLEQNERRQIRVDFRGHVTRLNSSRPGEAVVS